MSDDRYRNALLWAFDRLGVTGGMTPREQKRTMTEIGRVLLGESSPAGRYVPDEWTPAGKIGGDE